MLGDTNYNSDAWLGFKKALLSIKLAERKSCFVTRLQLVRVSTPTITEIRWIKSPALRGCNRDVFKVKVNRYLKSYPSF